MTWLFRVTPGWIVEGEELQLFTRWFDSLAGAEQYARENADGGVTLVGPYDGPYDGGES